MIAVLAKASNRNIYINSGAGIDDAERNRTGRAVFIPRDFFCIEIINALIFGSLSAKRDTGPHGFKYIFNALSQTAGENRRLCGRVVNEMPGFGA